MLMDRLDDRTDPLDGSGDVELGAGQQAARIPTGAAQVDPVQHPPSVGGTATGNRPGAARPRRWDGDHCDCAGARHPRCALRAALPPGRIARRSPTPAEATVDQGRSAVTLKQ
jgi:hypothetical protein